jgi:hypothetical protein
VQIGIKDMIEKIKEGVSTVLGLAIAVYFLIAVIVAGPYYTYKDIQRHDSFIRYIFISPAVGYFKGITWPYHYYSSIPSQDENENIVNFIKGNEYLFQAMNEIKASSLKMLFKTMSNNKTKYSDEDKSKDVASIQSLITLSKESFDKCDKDVLNGIHSEMGFIRDQFLLALNYYTKGIDNTVGNNADLDKENTEQNLEKGDAVLKKINIWMDKNLKEVLQDFKAK